MLGGAAAGTDALAGAPNPLGVSGLRNPKASLPLLAADAAACGWKNGFGFPVAVVGIGAAAGSAGAATAACCCCCGEKGFCWG